MQEIIIKNLDDATIERLERQAAATGWSLEEQIRHMLANGLEIRPPGDPSTGLDQEARQAAVEYIAELEKTVQELNAAAKEDAATIERLKKMVLEERQRFENLINVPVPASDTFTGTNEDV